MALKDRIKEARLNKGYTQEHLAKEIGVAKSTVTGYEKGNSEPSIDTIIKIMTVLEVDANYLWQDECDFPVQVSYNEMQHINKYRELNNHGREIIDYILNKEYENSKHPAVSPRQVRYVNYYYRLASAGTGQIIFDTPPTKSIEIPDLPEYKKVDYAIGVNGNSMEPIYSDGDTLLVHMTNDVNVGEIGIFQIDGQCYVKKRGENELISINTEYDNIPLNETASCMGKVIGKL